MATYPVGSQLVETVTVTDKATSALVDPASFLFTLKPPADSGIATCTYSWNGAVWTASEAIIGVAARAALGTFTLRITIPYVNTAKGKWTTGWKTTANGGGLGEGADDLSFEIAKTGALP